MSRRRAAVDVRNLHFQRSLKEACPMKYINRITNPIFRNIAEAAYAGAVLLIGLVLVAGLILLKDYVQPYLLRLFH